VSDKSAIEWTDAAGAAFFYKQRLNAEWAEHPKEVSR